MEQEKVNRKTTQTNETRKITISAGEKKTKAVCSLKIHVSSVRDLKFRRSHRRCSVREGILRNFAKFTGKHLC